MTIFLGIVGEIASVLGSYVIRDGSIMDTLVKVANEGGNIEPDVLEKYKKYQLDEQIKACRGWKKVSEIILLLIPGVNLIRTSILNKRVKTELLNDLKKDGVLVKHNSDMKDTDDKFEILFHDELVDLNYTLDEVKKLNDVTGFTYSIGKLDGKNIAIIGIPISFDSINKIYLKKDGFDKVYSFEKMTDKEAQNATFTIYPFMIFDKTKAELEKTIEEIKKSRIVSNTVIANKQEPIINYLANADTIKNNEPVLKKTMKL